MNPFIRVVIQPGRFPGPHDVDVALPLPEELVSEAYRPIDIPSENAGLAEIFCTPTVQRVHIMREREYAAKIISAAITKAVLDSMFARDTVMGR
jgi:hypothetical protein